MRRKCANLELPTKNIRISTEAYRDLSKLGTLEDTFDSVIKRLMINSEKSNESNREGTRGFSGPLEPKPEPGRQHNLPLRS